jgi:hypothetical protein
MPGPLVADEMGLGETFTPVAAAILCKLGTEKVLTELPLSILWENMVEDSVNFACTNCPGIVGEEQERYPLSRIKSVPRHRFEIQTTTLHGHPTLVSALEPILVVSMLGVAETFNTVIDVMAHGTKFKLVNMLHTKNANLTRQDLNTSIDKPENRWNIHVVLHDTLTSNEKPSSNGQLSYAVWCFGIFDESHWYKMKHTVGRQIALNVKIGFTLQVTATLGFH